MKKFLLNWATFMMVAVVSAGFVSCSSDDDGDDSGAFNADAIVGTWKFTHEEGYEKGKSYSEERSPDRICYYHIDKDGTCTRYYIDNRDGNGSWEVRDYPGFAFDAENQRLKFYESEWADIVTLTSKTLKIKYTYSDEDWGMETYVKVDDSVLDDVE